MAATPLVLNGRLLGVLYVDDARAGRFDVETCKLIEVLAGHLAVTIALHEAGGVDPAHGVLSSVEESDQLPGAEVVFHEVDATILVDGEYLIRGVPGRILFWILTENRRSGRTEFTNVELRRTRELELPTGNDNLEARLLTLRRRLSEWDGSFRLERIGRGRLRLEIESPVKLVRE